MGPMCHSRESGNPGFFAPGPCVVPAKAGTQYASPLCGRGRRGQRHRRVMGPMCHSRESGNPGFFAPGPCVVPAKAGTQYASPLCGRGRRGQRHRRVRGGFWQPKGVWIPASAGRRLFGCFSRGMWESRIPFPLTLSRRGRGVLTRFGLRPNHPVPPGERGSCWGDLQLASFCRRPFISIRIFKENGK